MLNIPSIIQTIYQTTPGNGMYGPSADERHKEIRIHFPNGEIRDLWNYDIVQESFNFTESVCSADVLKFGLCEASEVTFEVVGIQENFSGCKIEVFCEIDVSDLDTDHHCAGRYISDTDNCNREIGDEVERGVYSIPIGRFTVIECTRSKSDMSHRSVRAITKVFETNDDMTPFERWKIEQLHRTKTFKMIIPQYIDAQVSMVNSDNHYTIAETIMTYTNDGNVKDACYNGKVKFDYEDTDNNIHVDKVIARGNVETPGGSIVNTAIGVALTCSYTSSKVSYNTCVSDVVSHEKYPYSYAPLIKNDGNDNKNRVYGLYSYYDYDYSNYNVPYIDESTYRPEKAVSKFRKYLYDFMYNYKNYEGRYLYRYLAEQLFNDDSHLNMANILDFVLNRVESFGIKYSKNDSTKKGSYFSIRNNEFACFYDNGLNKKNDDGSITVRGRVIVPTLITIYYLTYATEKQDEKRPTTAQKILIIPILGQYVFDEYVVAEISSEYPTHYRIYERSTSQNVPPEITLKFDHTLENKSTTSSYKYGFYNAFTMRDIINGYLEINAMFGHQKRNGKYEYIRLGENVSSYGRFTKQEFEKLYFDEFDIDAVGYVIYNYKKNKDDKDVEVIYDLKTKGTSVYDMTDNKIFTILDEDESITDKQLRTKIENYLSRYFKPNLGIIHYYPAEITFHSKPYLESGDKYEIVLNPDLLNWKSFFTYNLNMTINGIQNSKTEMMSTSGTLIDGTTLSEDEDDDS